MNFALKYRPSNFAEIVGQVFLVRVLKNAFKLNKIPQAMLLIGSSGVGKTTTARVIALCLSCELGPTSDPCGICKGCVAVKNSTHPDVMEIDAASNTSVEDVKIILDNVRYVPIEGRFKIYIIDEVHMLSNSAFNALLKILEEPLANVKFILATTEGRKIPLTVISRCHRFDLLRITENDIVKQLRFVVENEKIDCDHESIKLIAKKSNGSMREAMFLLEQSLSYNAGKKVSIDSIKDILGYVDCSVICDILSSIIVADLVESLIKFQKTCESCNPIIVLENMLEVIHELCYSIILKESYTAMNQLIIKMQDLNKKSSNPVFLSRLWQALFKGIQEIKSASCIYSASEMLIIRLSYLSDLPSPGQIVKNIQNDLQINRAYNAMSEKNHNQFQQGSNMLKNDLFQHILECLKNNNKIILYKKLCNDVELIDCGDGFLMIKEIGSLPVDFSDDLTHFLNKVTGSKWFITVHKNVKEKNLQQDVSQNSVVQGIMEQFEGAKIVDF